jgi:AcrR family transcriptional regulator
MSGRDQATRDRLLKTAAKLFADHGFKRVTVRDICRSARTNVASVNYHFRNKFGLYREVLLLAIEQLQSVTCEAKQAGEGCQPADKLRRFVHIHLRRILDRRSGWIHHLVNREITDPTPALDALVNQGLRPRVEYLSSVVAEIIDLPPTHPSVQRSVASTIGQVVSYRPNPLIARLGFKTPIESGEIDAVADHIAEFSLAGIRAVGHVREKPVSHT